MKPLTLHPIGVMRTVHTSKIEAPRQPAAAQGTPGVIHLRDDLNLQHAVQDLDGWERIWVVFWFDRNESWRPKVLPPRSTAGRKGVLATRAPHRPNPIGLSALRLVRVDGLQLHVLDVDLLDGTPILDIKPYVAYSDAFPESASGWLAAAADDPRAAWTVAFTPKSEAQLAWLEPRLALPLRERIVATLSLGPEPHPYRRIRRGTDGRMQLAVQDWRVDFSAGDRRVTVLQLRSGYGTARAKKAPAVETLSLHREFTQLFAPKGDSHL